MVIGTVAQNRKKNKTTTKLQAPTDYDDAPDEVFNHWDKDAEDGNDDLMYNADGKRIK